jgi:YD repeat-containing protein
VAQPLFHNSPVRHLLVSGIADRDGAEGSWQPAHPGYDVNGNWVSERINRPGGAQLTAYSFDSADRLTRTVETDGTKTVDTAWTCDQADHRLSEATSRPVRPSTGRFIGQDPAEGDDERPGSYQKYLYAYGNPTAHRGFRCPCPGNR